MKKAADQKKNKEINKEEELKKKKKTAQRGPKLIHSLLHNPDVGHGGCWSVSLCGFPARGNNTHALDQPEGRHSLSGELYNVSVEWTVVCVLQLLSR